MSDPVQQIKERANIVEVVGQYVKLTKAGKNYKGLSPFRKEKTPSFYVSPDKGMYYDFSSGQGGDIFSFVQTMEGLDFKGALALLAERTGVVLVHESKDARDARERLYGALEDACCFFETKLSEHEAARTYLRDRGLEEGTQRSFRLGFAPDGWQSLRDFLTGKGYSLEELEQAGLVKKGDRGSYYDRFRSRIMFPIMDPAGRVIAFSGRIFGEAAEDEANAKYLNSPETPLFDKGRTLYGYHKAKQAIRLVDCSILVEGQMDIVMSHQAGFIHTVAVSGTGLTADHLALLSRVSNRLILAFDADGAGLASAGRAAILALERGMDVRAVRIPTGKDPADCIRESVALWREAVEKASHIVDFFLQNALALHKASNDDERALALLVRDTVLPYVARVKSGVEQGHFVRSIANKLGIAEEAVWRDVHVHAHTHTSGTPETASGAHVAVARERVVLKTETPQHGLERSLAGLLFWLDTLEERPLSKEDIVSSARERDVPLETILATYDSERDQLVLQTDILYADHPAQGEAYRELLDRVARVRWMHERTCLAEELRVAEREHDEERARAILIRFQEVSRRIETLVP
ncbi:MAG: DNA primase [Candidatus Pacebacteria bacterium]|nr:DNA primase [Candidatus Paceibacterota bacterium]